MYVNFYFDMMYSRSMFPCNLCPPVILLNACADMIVDISARIRCLPGHFAEFSAKSNGSQENADRLQLRFHVLATSMFTVLMYSGTCPERPPLVRQKWPLRTGGLLVQVISSEIYMLVVIGSGRLGQVAPQYRWLHEQVPLHYINFHFALLAYVISRESEEIPRYQ